MLLVSQGVPMILMGDEVGQSTGRQQQHLLPRQRDELARLDAADEDADLLRFCRLLIRFRKMHPILRHSRHPGQPDETGAVLGVACHGTRPSNPDWSDGSRVLGLTLHRTVAGGIEEVVYIGLNMHWETLGFDLPPPPPGRRWHVSVNTAMPAPDDIWEPGQEPLLSSQDNFLVGGRSVIVLFAKSSGQG